MPKVLVAISSCQAYETNGWNDPQRRTWLKDVVSLGWNYKFFHGRGAWQKEDVEVVECNDRYFDLTNKSYLKIRWAMNHDYDFVFCCFPDTYACAERLVKSGFEKYDYSGDLANPHGDGEYCQGGCGFFLSNLAMRCVVDRFKNDPEYARTPYEDCRIADIIRSKPFLTRGKLAGFNFQYVPPRKNNEIVTCHLSNANGGFRPELVWECHKTWQES